MSLTTTSGLVAPALHEQLVITPVREFSAPALAFQNHRTHQSVYQVNKLTDDATAAWTAEGATITASDPAFAQVEETLRKVAGFVVLSNEMWAGASPDALVTAAASLSRDVIRKINAAVFAETQVTGATKAVGVTATELALDKTNLDSFLAGIAAIKTQGGTPSAIVINPALALELKQLKTATGSNQYLIQNNGSLSIDGVRVLEVPSVATDVAYVTDSRNVLVLGEGQTFVDPYSHSQSDQVAVRATQRVAYLEVVPNVALRIAGV